MTAQITVRGARLHNLKNVTLTIPKNQLVVLTGLSGSGKSTLGFDILHKEGQRQYLEALGLAAFGLAKPPVDAITGRRMTYAGLEATIARLTGGLAARGYGRGDVFGIYAPNTLEYPIAFHGAAQLGAVITTVNS